MPKPFLVWLVYCPRQRKFCSIIVSGKMHLRRPLTRSRNCASIFMSLNLFNQRKFQFISLALSAGKIRAIGTSNFTAPRLARALQLSPKEQLPPTRRSSANIISMNALNSKARSRPCASRSSLGSSATVHSLVVFSLGNMVPTPRSC